MYKYLIEVETMEHKFVMVNWEASGGAVARRCAMHHLDGLGGSIVACSKDAPEFGDTCKRELIG